MPTKSAFSAVGLAHKVCLAAEEQGYTPELLNTLAELRLPRCGARKLGP